MRFIRPKRVLAAVVVAATAISLAACTTGTPDEGAGTTTDAGDLIGKVFFLTPNSQITRFESYDKPAMEEALAKIAPGLELVVQSADNDPLQQLQQAQSAITQGAVAIIMAPPVPNQSQAVVEVAHAAGVPVIDYAYASTESSIDAYVTVPFRSIGTDVANLFVDEMVGKDTKPVRIAEITGDPSFFFDQEIKAGTDEVLDPLVASGDVEVVCTNDNLELSTDNARTAMEGCLSQSPDIDAVLVHNDSSALGVVAALSAQNLLGTIPVYGGYDGESGIVQQVLAGNVRNTMVPPYSVMASKAAQLAVALAVKDTAAAEALYTGTYDTGTTEVPAIYNENVLITADNVGTDLVDTGILTKEEACGGVAATSTYCK